MADPRISIALATYQGADHVAEQLATLAGQTWLPSELVVQDDASTDETVAIVEAFAAGAPFPVRIARNAQNLGYRKNFRIAANRCTGDLIAFCDQDDLWAPDKLAVMTRCFDDPEVMLAYHNAIVINEDGGGGRPLYDANERRRYLEAEPLHPMHWSHGLTQVFRSELLEHDELWPMAVNHMRGGLISHDSWFIFLAGALGKVAFVDEPLLRYRQHADNLFGAPPKMGWAGRTSIRLTRFARQEEWARDSVRAKAEIMRLIAAKEKAPKDRLLAISKRFDRLADAYQRRLCAYALDSAPARLAALLRSIAENDYGRAPWRLDWRALPRDIWSGVIRGRTDPPDQR